MDSDSINNLTHVKKIISLEFNKYMKLQNKDLAYREYYKNLVNILELLRSNIEIANRPDEFIKIKKRCNPDDKKT
jgi:predicted nucleic-acid-binding Zn-ribbon protein